MSRSLNDFHLHLLGAQFQLGQKKDGVNLGPDIIRKHGEIKHLLSNLKIHDFGDIYQTENQPLGEPYGQLYNQTLNLLESDCDLNLILGGDHSISLATIPALLRRYPNLRVIWVDAHADINTPDTSPTGSLHGMPLAALTGLFRCQDYWKGFSWLDQKFDYNRLAFLGVRSVDPGEEIILDELGVKFFTTNDIKNSGMKHCLQELKQHLDPNGAHPLHLSFDIDCVDPSIVPATGAKVNDGLLRSDVLTLGTELPELFNLVSLELVELNPLLADNARELSSSLAVFQMLLKEILNSLSLSKTQSLSSSTKSWPALS